jgi:hypothetical protein
MKKDEDQPMSADHFSLYGTSGFYATYNLVENEKARTRFIQGVEQIVRGSFEYSNFIKYLKTEAKLTYCDVLTGLNEDIMKDLSLEMHHYPFTLYDITETVLMKHLLNNMDFTRLSIANEVMDLHFSLQVGIIPLTLTVHQLAHSGGIIADLDNIFGNYTKFAEDYELFIPEPAMTRLKVYESKSKNKALLKNTNRNTLEFNPGLFVIDYEPTSGDPEVDQWEKGKKPPPWDPVAAFGEDTSYGD